MPLEPLESTGLPWCSLHKTHPGNCFKLHHPEAFQGDKTTSAKKLKKRAVKEHLRRQRAR
jgi:hypothetical protein